VAAAAAAAAALRMGLLVAAVEPDMCLGKLARTGMTAWAGLVEASNRAAVGPLFLST
jgi:hypothetical protein